MRPARFAVARLARTCFLRPPSRRALPASQPVAPRSQAVVTPRRAMAAAASGASAGAQPAHPPNRLAREESPYLLQHAHNPVDWYPWGEEAFEKARREGKPIFLSIGYSTCHWCHVMERESFESESVAALLNADFVPIKVDREERPDVDRVYMAYVQATQGGGGWPMSVWLTPSLHPFLGGTYFPPDDSGGRRGFKSLLRTVAQVWGAQRADVESSAADAVSQLRSALVPVAKPGAANAAAADVTEAARASLRRAVAALSQRYDAARGGFGAAPKFPRPAELDALLTHAALGGGGTLPAAEARAMAAHTLRCMLAGGIWDHVGGGFARYSVDDYWHVPHFEKMLYDNAQLASSLLDAAAQLRAAGDVAAAEALARGARGTLDYLRRDMTAAQGGIFSAEDADSAEVEGGPLREGFFYAWSLSELQAVLGGADSEAAKLATLHYDVRSAGNCVLSPRSDPHGEFAGLNVLREAQPVQETAAKLGMTVEKAETILAEARRKLHAARANRPRPRRDDKVICAWNGLAAAALAKASRALAAFPDAATPRFPVDGCAAAEYADAAARALAFVKETLWEPQAAGGPRLRRSFRVSPSAAAAASDDYAACALGALRLYEARGDVAWLVWARELLTALHARFWDAPAGGGYAASEAGDDAILLRLRESYDGAEPAASSLAAAAWLQLARLLGHDGANADDARSRARATTAAFADRLRSEPLAMPALAAYASSDDTSAEAQIIIVGRRGSAAAEALADAAFSVFLPGRSVIHVDLEDADCTGFWRGANGEALRLAEQHAADVAGGAAAVALVCARQSCRPPVRDAAALEALLRSLADEAARSCAGAGTAGPTVSRFDLSKAFAKPTAEARKEE